jgi:predicted amidohydrolase YtcJ
VYTLSSDDKRAKAIGVNGRRISLIGSDKDVRQRIGKATRMVDAKGKVVLPGFIDSHGHLAALGICLTQPDLSKAGSKDEVLAIIKDAVKGKEEGDWIVVDWANGWQEIKWKGDREYIRKEEIDRVVPNNPVVLSRIDGHCYSVNSRALEILNIPAGTAGYEMENSRPTGILKEPAIDMLDQIPEIHGAFAASMEELVKGLKRAMKRAHELGVTSVHDIYLGSEEIKAYRRLKDKSELRIRVSLSPRVEYLAEVIKLGLGPRFGDDKLRLGAVKILADGSTGARTAALVEPYSDDPQESGLLIWAQEELQDMVLKAHENGIQLAIHTIGDRAIELVLDCFEKANKEGGERDLRHRIEHFSMASRKQIERAAHLNIIASMQPNFVGGWGLPGGEDEVRVGSERQSRANPFAWVREAGMKMAFGSDCMPFSPLYGIHWAVNAPFPSQKISPGEAFKAYTVGGAYATFEENYKGTIEEGKLADLIILDRNPFSKPEEIKDMHVKFTMLDGEIVYDRLNN